MFGRNLCDHEYELYDITWESDLQDDFYASNLGCKVRYTQYEVHKCKDCGNIIKKSTGTTRMGW